MDNYESSASFVFPAYGKISSDLFSVDVGGNSGSIYVGKLEGIEHDNDENNEDDRDLDLISGVFLPSGGTQQLNDQDIGLDQHEYTVPGAYFSPLTSPALQAQKEPQQNDEMLDTSTMIRPSDEDLLSSLHPASGADVFSMELGYITRGAPNLKPQRSQENRSAPVSPALRPRISPIISSRLPEGAHEDHASLLASKSNYQNILDGTNLPGVSYPSEPSTGLSSKRTSHKIAEQGRRNRINSALAEIDDLIPQDTGKTESTQETDTSGAQATNSKASIVERATQYIRQLQGELADEKERGGKLDNYYETTAPIPTQGTWTSGDSRSGRFGFLDIQNQRPNNFHEANVPLPTQNPYIHGFSFSRRVADQHQRLPEDVQGLWWRAYEKLFAQDQSKCENIQHLWTAAVDRYLMAANPSAAIASNPDGDIARSSAAQFVTNIKQFPDMTFLRRMGEVLRVVEKNLEFKTGGFIWSSLCELTMVRALSKIQLSLLRFNNVARI